MSVLGARLPVAMLLALVAFQPRVADLGVRGEESVVEASADRTELPIAEVTVSNQHGGTVVDARLPGRLLDRALPRIGEGRREVVLLVERHDESGVLPVLMRLDVERQALTVLYDRLPAETDALVARDLDGDGRDELLVGGEGWIAGFESAPGAERYERRRPLLAGDEIDLRSRPRVVPGASHERLYLTRVGALDLYRSTGSANRPGAGRRGALASAGATDLPVAAVRIPGGLRLRSPAPTLLLRDAREPLVATGPEVLGKRRLRSVIVDSETGEEWEAWSRLPGPEVVQWSWYELLDDRPILVVTTNSADKLGIFEEQRLRVFVLDSDRTRAGSGPMLTAEIKSKRWQRIWLFVADADGDGDDDLVLVQTDGLEGRKMVVEAFLNDGRGRFESQTPRTAMDRPVASPLFAPDVTGDVVPDLVVAHEESISVFAGVEPLKRRLVEKEPTWVFEGEWGEEDDKDVEVDVGGAIVHRQGATALERLQQIDLDGDGRGELVYPQRGRHQPGRVRIVFLP